MPPILNVSKIISYQPNSPWSDLYDRNSAQAALEFLTNYKSQEVYFDAERDSAFLKKLFSARQILNSQSPTEENLRESCEAILDLIDETFKDAFGEKSRADFEALKSNLANYNYNNGQVTFKNFIPLQKAYLKFLLRNKFFENSEDKVALFASFHSEILNCGGGMITRLDQYVSSNLTEFLTKNIASEIKSKYPISQGNQVHLDAFIGRFLLGMNNEDSFAINITAELPFYEINRLALKAVSGDFFDELFFDATRKFFADAVSAKSYDDNLLYYPRLQSDNAIFLTKTCKDFSQALLKAVPREDVGDSNFAISIPTSIQEIVFTEYLDELLSDEEKKAEIKKLGGLKSALEKTTKDAMRSSIAQTIESLKEHPASKNILIDDERTKNLEELSVIYSSLLSRVTFLTSKQLVDYVKNLILIEEGDAFFIKQDLTDLLPDQIQKFLINKVTKFKATKKEDGAIETIKTGDDSIDGQITTNDFLELEYINNSFLNSAEIPVLEDEILSRRYLYFVFNKKLDEDKLNAALEKFTNSDGSANFQSFFNNLPIIRKIITDEQIARVITAGKNNPYFDEIVINSNAFLFLSENGCVEALRAILESAKDNPDLLEKLFDQKTKDGFSAFILAAQKGQVEVVKTILESVKDKPALLEKLFDQKTLTGFSAFMIAAYEGQVEVVKTILESVKDKPALLEKLFDQEESKGYSAFIVAAGNGQAEVVKTILESAKDKSDLLEKLFDQKTLNLGASAFIIAAGNRQVEVVKTILEFAKDKPNLLEKLFDQKDLNGFSAFMIVAEKGHVELVKTILEFAKDKPDLLEKLIIEGRRSLSDNYHSEIKEIIEKAEGVLNKSESRNQGISFSVVPVSVDTVSPKGREIT